MTGDGYAFDIDPSAVSAEASHPFKISAEFDDPDNPTVCLVSIVYGTLQGEYATGTTYTGVPLFEGSGGTTLDDDPAPDFDVGVTARTNYFYFVVTTDEFGRIDNCWIEHFVAADLPLTDTPYVQPGFPLASDVGSAGTYYWLLGTVQVAVTGTPPDEVYLPPIINQSATTSLGFYTAGAAGRVYQS
jgi:hypothetical protein